MILVIRNKNKFTFLINLLEGLNDTIPNRTVSNRPTEATISDLSLQNILYEATLLIIFHNLGFI